MALPAVGYVATLYEGYFDESGAGLGQKIFCVGGYVVDSAVVPAMTEAWTAALVKRGVVIFHMKDCAHGNGEFKHLDSVSRIELETNLIEIIHAHMTAGVTVSINITQYEKNPLTHPIKGISPNYMQLCVYMLMINIGRIFIDEKLEGKILYNFESGHHLQRSANSHIQEITRSSDLIANTYAGHAYITKSGSVLLQAADLLVWLTTKNLKNIVIRKPERKDFLALTGGGKHYGANIFAKDGVFTIAETTPYHEGPAMPGAGNMLRQLHSGETPTDKVGGWRFDAGQPPRWVVS